MPKTLPRWLLFSSALLSVAACQEIPSTVPSQERATQATEDPYNLSKVVLENTLKRDYREIGRGPMSLSSLTRHRSRMSKTHKTRHHSPRSLAPHRLFRFSI